jgi:hypothetical protein
MCKESFQDSEYTISYEEAVSLLSIDEFSKIKKSKPRRVRCTVFEQMHGKTKKAGLFLRNKNLNSINGF